MKKYLVLGALGLAMVGAQAQSAGPGQMYGELGYTAAKLTDSDSGDNSKTSPNALRGILGVEINPYLAAEGMLSLGMGSASIKLNGQTVPGVKAKIDNMFGIYIKPKYAVNESLEVFGRLGFARAKMKYSGGGITESGSDSSLSYGAGLGVALSKTITLNADYMQYVKKDGAKLNGFTFGVGYKF